MSTDRLPRRALLAAAVAASAMAAATRSAAAQVAYRYEAQAASVPFVPGGPTVIEIYLRETRLGAGLTLADRGGLFGAGFGVRYAGGGQLPILSIAGNPSLFSGFTAVELTATTATFLQAVPITATTGAVPDASGRLLLGQVTLGPTASALPVAFEVWRRDGLGGNTLAFDGTDLDFNGPGVLGAVVPSPVLVYATIPEPAMLGLLVPASALLARRR